MTSVAQSLGDAFNIGYHAMSSSERVISVALLVLLALVGAWAARSDRDAHLKSLRRGGVAAASFLVPGALLVGWFIVFDSDSIIGVATTPAEQTGWLLSMSLLGAGLSLLSGVAATGSAAGSRAARALTGGMA